MLRNVKYIVLCASIFLFMLTIGTWLKVRSDLTGEGVEQLIKSEIPNGASKPQVLAFLDAHGISYSGYEKYPPEIDLKQYTDFQSEKFKGKTQLIDGYIFADIRNCGRWTLFRCDIYISFYFDDKGNMVEYLVRAVEDGP